MIRMRALPVSVTITKTIRILLIKFKSTSSSNRAFRLTDKRGYMFMDCIKELKSNSKTVPYQNFSSID